MSATNDDRELHLASLLADYDTALADGTRPDVSTASLPVTAEERRRLHAATRCLERLDRMWPRAPNVEEPAPTTIDRFRVDRVLGHGGFGIVYSAYDEHLQRPVALKVQRPEAMISPSLRQRFLREARVAARLEHPHIAGLYEVGRAGFRLWIASQYVDGESLASWLQTHHRPVPATVAASLVALLADALAYAHSQGVLHRDLKPSNVLLQRSATTVDDDLSTFRPKLIDFGLAKLAEGDSNETRTGALIGTPRYMAPEQAAGDVRAIGAATDVYGLGTILYELLTGQSVFPGETDVQLLRQVMDTEPVAPRKVRREIPADLEAITLKCLEKVPGQRYSTAGAVATDLRRFLSGEPTTARPLTTSQRMVKWARRRPALAGLVSVSIAATLAIALMSVAYVMHLRDSALTSEQLRREAEASAQQARAQERVANRQLYASRMRLGYELIERGDGRRVSQLLEPYASPSPLAQLRGFEWFHLNRRAHAEQCTLAGHEGEVYSVAYAPSGLILASGSQDGQIIFWNPRDGRELTRMRAHTSCVNAVAYSPDGQILASAGCDDVVKFWNATTHELLATFEQGKVILTLAFSPNGRRLAIGAVRGGITLYAVAEMKELAQISESTADINWLFWRDDETIIAPGHAGRAPDLGDLLLWNVDQDIQELLPVHRPVRAMALSSLDELVLARDDEAVYSIFDSELRMPGLTGRAMPIRSIAFDPSAELMAVGYEDGCIRVADWWSGEWLQTFVGHSGRVQSLAFSPRGDVLASASFDGKVKLWPMRFESRPTLECPTVSSVYADNPATFLTTSADHRFAAAVTNAKQVTVFDLTTGEVVARHNADQIVGAISLSATDPAILYGYSPAIREVWQWDWKRDTFSTVGATPKPFRKGCVISNDGKYYVADHENLVFDVVHQQTRWTAPFWGPPRNVQFSPDGRTIAINRVEGPRDSLVELPEVIELDSDKSFPLSTHILAISNGAHYVVESSGSGLRVLNVRTGEVVCDLTLATMLSTLAFSPDDNTLAIAEVSGEVTLWNLATGLATVHFPSANRVVHALRFSSDGRSLAVIVLKQTDQLYTLASRTYQVYLLSGLGERNDNPALSQAQLSPQVKRDE